MFTEIVKRAMVYTVTDIGQLSPAERRELNAAVKRGHLSRGKGGPFPILKTVWAHPGFDFETSRREYVNRALALAYLDGLAADERRRRISNANDNVGRAEPSKQARRRQTAPAAIVGQMEGTEMATETPIGDCERCGRESVALCGFCDECVAGCCTLTCEADYPADDPTAREDWEDN